MKILAVNGSPRGQKGNTDRILQSFLEGARDAGASAETVYLKDKKINHCTGCFTCWSKTPGVCIHRDDMPDLLEKGRRADVLVYATPLYVFTVSGLMKDFMDRFIMPLLKPYIIKRGEHYIHPGRYENEWPKKLVLISNCGFPERHHFSGLVETFRLFTSGPDLKLDGMILCAGAELLNVPDLKDSVSWYLKAARQAGREFMEEGRIKPETQAVLDRQLADPEVYSRMANAYWDSVIQDKNVSPGLSDSGNLPPELPAPPPGNALPSDIHQVITGQAAVFNPEAAGDLRADIQFVFSGREPGEYVLRVKDGRCTAHRGRVTNPSLTVISPSEVWLQIARGEFSGQTAFMKGLYRTEGDLGLLLQMGDLFSKKNSTTS
jgi:putative NADPH-quinone reductase/putative sterol carrier protein